MAREEEGLGFVVAPVMFNGAQYPAVCKVLPNGLLAVGASMTVEHPSVGVLEVPELFYYVLDPSTGTLATGSIVTIEILTTQYGMKP